MGKNGIFHQFFRSEKAGGLVLIGCTILSLILANSPTGPDYIHCWHLSANARLGRVFIPFRIEDWINEGLMTFFFLLVGLEIRLELLTGELASMQKALLPLIAAVGGMLIPAAIHLLLNHGRVGGRGFGIPMATDIAFSLGVLSLLGKRFPLSLKVFLTALAIIDDLGAVILIAIFYTEKFSWLFLGAGLGLTALLAMLSRLNVKSPWVYCVAGLLLWYFVYRSGVHPTLSGILLAFVIPFRGSNDEPSLSDRMEHALHRPVAFFVVPLFALANTAIPLPAGWMRTLGEPNSLGIAMGLMLGKCLGIAGFSLMAIGFGWAGWPDGMNRRRLVGLGLLGGIGFTMSVFISNLAFPGDPALIESSKVAVLLASFGSAVLGWGVLSAKGKAGHR